MIFNSIEGRLFTESSVKPHRHRDFIRLNREQQVKENVAKKHLLRLVKEVRRTGWSDDQSCTYMNGWRMDI